MTIAFRTDSSVRIGSGHLMRCLTLADRLRSRGDAVVFICRDLPGNQIPRINACGHEAITLPAPKASGGITTAANEYDEWLGVDRNQDARETVAALSELPCPVDWLIVDHYALGKGWEKEMRPLVQGIMVIDDLANREHDCDVLLDQNLFRDQDTRYDALVTAQCNTLLGPKYALLRHEFLAISRKKQRSQNNARRLFVFFGGADTTNETGKALEAIAMLNRDDIAVDVVIGGSNPNRDDLIAACSDSDRIRSYTHVDYMAELMAQADIAIGAGGTTTWERCRVGLPSLIVSIAENQVAISREVDRIGVADYLGRSEDVTARDVAQRISRLLSDNNRLRQMSSRCSALVDGQGTARVVERLAEKSKQGVTP